MLRSKSNEMNCSLKVATFFFFFARWLQREPKGSVQMQMSDLCAHMECCTETSACVPVTRWGALTLTAQINTACIAKNRLIVQPHEWGSTTPRNQARGSQLDKPKRSSFRPRPRYDTKTCCAPARAPASHSPFSSLNHIFYITAPITSARLLPFIHHPSTVCSDFWSNFNLLWHP